MTVMIFSNNLHYNFPNLLINFVHKFSFFCLLFCFVVEVPLLKMICSDISLLHTKVPFFSAAYVPFLFHLLCSVSFSFSIHYAFFLIIFSTLAVTFMYMYCLCIKCSYI